MYMYFLQSQSSYLKKIQNTFGLSIFMDMTPHHLQHPCYYDTVPARPLPLSLCCWWIFVEVCVVVFGGCFLLVFSFARACVCMSV